MTTIGLNVLTHSRTSCFKTCRRKHYFRYELGVRRVRSSAPLRIGGAIHQGLDARAGGQSEEDALAIAALPYAETPAWVNDDEKVHEWLIEREKTLRLLAGYFWYYGGFGVAEYLATEQSFELPLKNPETGGTSTRYRVAGQIDKIARLDDGKIAIIEHKTCSDPIDDDSSDYWRRLRIDQQISLYYLAARELGHNVETVLYDVIRKPTIKPRAVGLTDENGDKIVTDAAGQRVFTKQGKPRQTPDTKLGYVLHTRRETPAEYGERLTEDIVKRPAYYYQRREIPRLEADIAEMRYELWDMQKAIGEAANNGRHYRNTAACFKPYPCEYFDLCFESIDPRDRLPDGFEIVEDIHPELTEPQQR